MLFGFVHQRAIMVTADGLFVASANSLRSLAARSERLRAVLGDSACRPKWRLSPCFGGCFHFVCFCG
jgi:hypothetical protein